jgi:hypothetical protein
VRPSPPLGGPGRHPRSGQTRPHQAASRGRYSPGVPEARSPEYAFRR